VSAYDRGPAPLTAGAPTAGRLTKADEWPRHQVARTFDTVASDSPHWSDGFYFTTSDDTGTASLYTAIRLYPNNDVMDGYACIGIDGRQHNLRWSRRLRPAIDDLRVGPLSLEIVEPLAELRTVCAPNDYGISYDLTWRGLHEPYLEGYVERYANGRLTAQRCNYDQCCDVSGWIEVAGRRLAVAPQRWVGVRDHSWGLGRTGGPPTSAAAPLAPGAGQSTFAVRQWVMVRFPERVVFWQLHQAADGRYTMFESRVLPRTPEGGEPWSYLMPAELELQLVPGHRRLRTGTITLQRPDGGHDRFGFTLIGTPVYLQGAGYWQGFDDGLGRGVYRGDNHGEGEIWDVSSPSEVRDPTGLFRARPDAYAETFGTFQNLDDPAETGSGHLEVVVSGEHPDLT
jgi:hypothetical protein